MNLDKLFTYLSDKGFQESRTGNIMFPIYIYTYDPSESYNLKDEIKQLNKKLSRPKNNLQCQVINIYDFFIQYLSEMKIGKNSFLNAVFEKEKDDPENTHFFIEDKLHEDSFYNYLQEEIKKHFTTPPIEKKSYLLVHGFDKIYPYLRVSTFSKNIENIVKGFKVILFYPGEYQSGYYRMFKEVESENAYRATYLNQFIN
jgi:hypothetical protein